MSSGCATFLWAAGASLAVDVVNWNRAISDGRVCVPAPYDRLSFWFARALLALVAGALALAHGGGNGPWAAVQIGTATPLLIQRMTRSVPSAGRGRTRGSTTR